MFSSKPGSGEFYFKPRSWEKPLYFIFASEGMTKLAKYAALKITNAINIANGGKPATLSELTKEGAGSNYFLKGKTVAEIAEFEGQTKLNEMIHLVPLPFFAALFADHVISGNYVGAMYSGSLLYGTVSLIGAARQQRARIREIAKRKDLKREEGKSS